MEQGISILLFINIALIIVHEMDAIRCKEWELIIFIKDLKENTAYVLFTIIHIPIYVILFFVLTSHNPDLINGFGIGLSVFLIGHKGLHYLFEKHPKNRFNHSFSRFIINGMVIISVLYLLMVFSFEQNHSITITRLDMVSDKIPTAFNGYKILQISDLHNASFGQKQSALVEKIRKVSPNVIVVTGDSIDSRKDNTNALQLFEQITQIAPVYYVTGNHEAWSDSFEDFQNELEQLGVRVLRNESKMIQIEDSQILLMGLDDPDFQGDPLKDQLEQMLKNNSGYFKILLSHRPELIDVYAAYAIDLVFSGHAHGGQVRLPFVGGIVAPNQGWLPEYTIGNYHVNDTEMIVSRGLGNSIIPQRLFNQPEIIVVTLLK